MNIQSKTPLKDDLIFSSDGKEIGKVKAVEPECFQVRVSFRHDFWLPITMVDHHLDGSVALKPTSDEMKHLDGEDASHAGKHKHAA